MEGIKGPAKLEDCFWHCLNRELSPVTVGFRQEEEGLRAEVVDNRGYAHLDNQVYSEDRMQARLDSMATAFNDKGYQVVRS